MMADRRSAFRKVDEAGVKSAMRLLAECEQLANSPGVNLRGRAAGSTCGQLPWGSSQASVAVECLW